MYMPIGGMSQGHFWSYRLTVRTPGFHPGNRSSILRRITIQKGAPLGAFFVCDSTSESAGSRLT